jgi:hypothetical protein
MTNTGFYWELFVQLLFQQVDSAVHCRVLNVVLGPRFHLAKSESEGTEGCLTRTNGKAAVSSFETRVGAAGTLCRASGPGEEKSAFRSLSGCIVLGCWELKWKFRIISPGRVCIGANS